ncbi:MAG: DUF1007 family protein [Rhizobiaceae bacterium]|nr:DUF1007 family protein [Rhizobiaceae bacterium]
MPNVLSNGRALALAAVLAFPPAAVSAHPHVFAEASLEVTVASDGTVTQLGHVWRFDDLFSSTVLLEFDANKDLKLDEAELGEIADVVYNSLAEFDYFQFVTAGGKDVVMKKPDKFVASFDDNVLTIMFASEPAEPLSLHGKVAFGVYDPTFYTAIDFIEDDNMMVDNMPAACRREVIRPDPDEAIAQNQQSLTDAFFDNPGGNDMSKLFATRLELTCG